MHVYSTYAVHASYTVSMPMCICMYIYICTYTVCMRFVVELCPCLCVYACIYVCVCMRKQYACVSCTRHRAYAPVHHDTCVCIYI